MSGPYDELLFLPHPVSKTRPQMSMLDRAAQFSPFAALAGYGDAIREAGRLTTSRIELSGERREELDWKQQFLMAQTAEQPALSVTYFVPDDRKDGGAYVTQCGHLKRLDLAERQMILTSGVRIPLDDIAEIESELF